MNHAVKHELGNGVFVHGLIGADGTTWAVSFRDAVALIDCATSEPAAWLKTLGLPMPDVVLHTHVQPEHTREGTSLPGSRILVAEAERERATDFPAWQRRARTTWDNPDEWMETLGREMYGIAGSITRLPPATPLSIAGTFHAGNSIPWHDLVFTVLALPGHDREAVGFVLSRHGKNLALFSGDLLRHPSHLVNLYDLEVAYHVTVIDRLPVLLRQVAALKVPLFPATGPALVDGARAANDLATRIEKYQQALIWESGEFTTLTAPACTSLGRWDRVADGVWQINNYGNAILFIDDQGRGLMIDPGPCGFGQPDREGTFNADLALFEAEAGLRTIDTVLITHPHGDHYDQLHVVRQRYPGVKAVALDLVAEVVNQPTAWPYPALLPWYNLGHDQHVDQTLQVGTTWHWHDIAIEVVWLPGHIIAHAGYLVHWRADEFIACTGDVVQSRGESMPLFFALCNDSPADVDQGCLRTVRTLLGRGITLNLGGHSSRFRMCDSLYRESLRRMEHALPALADLFHDGDLVRASRRPGWPEPPPSLLAATPSGR